MRRLALMILVYLMALLCLSCQKAGQGIDAPSRENTISFLANEVKSGTDIADESTVYDFSIFVFNADGTFNASGYSTSEILRLSVTEGNNLDVYAVTNCGSELVETVSDRNSLLAKMDENLFTPSGIGRFVMTGHRIVDVNGSTGTIGIPVDRILARIEIVSIQNNLPQATGDITINGIFLSNLPDKGGYFTNTLTTWQHCRGRNLTSYNWVNDSTIRLSIANGQTATLNRLLYCYPNITTIDTTSETWCPRHTRIVVAAIIEGQQYYYPISINSNIPDNKLVRNKRYIIRQLIINNVGSLDPEAIIQPTDLDFTISVGDWKEITKEPIFSN